MKSLLLLTILASLAPLGLSAQQPTGRSPELRKQPAAQPQRTLPPSLGAQQSAGTRPATGLAWRRGIYRQLELTQPANTPLYAEGEDGQSLFDLIIQLYLEGKIKGYTYGTGRERLDAAHVLEPRDFLERFRIPYTEVSAGGKPRYEVLPADLPTSQVRSYYLKEQHSLDRATTSYRREVELLCPILETVGDYGTAPMPLFWLRYSELAPYLREAAAPMRGRWRTTSPSASTAGRSSRPTTTRSSSSGRRAPRSALPSVSASRTNCSSCAARSPSPIASATSHPRTRPPRQGVARSSP